MKTPSTQYPIPKNYLAQEFSMLQRTIDPLAHHERSICSITKMQESTPIRQT